MTLELDAEGPEKAPLSASRDTAKNNAATQVSESKVPGKMLIDAPDQISSDSTHKTAEDKVPFTVDGENEMDNKPKVSYPTEINAQSRMLSEILNHMQTQVTAVPSIMDVSLNEDSSLNKSETITRPIESIASITEKLNDSFDDLAKAAKINEALLSQVESEIPSVKREEVLIHFMLHNVVIEEYSGFTGDKLNMPTIEQIKDKMGPDWDSSEFSGWDSDGIAHNSDIFAITKKLFDVKIFFNDTFYKSIKVVDGTKTLKAIERNIETLDLIEPLLVNYSIYCSTKVITGDTSIHLKPLTKEAQRTDTSSKTDTVTVIFAITPTSVGIDTSTMTKEELRKAMIIQRVSVPLGSSVQQPSDELLAEHGLRLPFDQYYKWSHDLENIDESIVIKVVPLSITSLSSKISDMSSEEIIDIGKQTAKRAWNAIKYPALIYMEHKLVKEYEAGRKLQTRDFVFLRKGGSLMLYKYTGVKSVVEIPAVVDGMYVKHIHPNAFTSGPFKPWHLLNKHKLFSTDHFNSSTGSMTQLILPVTIKYLPANFLYGVTGIEILVVPESVTEISPNAFAGSGLTELYFNGACPKGFTHNCIDFDVFVRRQNYKSFF